MTNEALQKENIEEDFKPIDYKIKSNVNHDFFCELQKKSIKNILEMDISPKYKSQSKDINWKVLNKIYNYSNWLKDCFNIKYLDLFSDNHNNEKSLLKFVFKGKEIELTKTKSFYYLINNKNNKDKNIAKDLSNISKRFFIYDKSTLSILYPQFFQEFIYLIFISLEVMRVCSINKISFKTKETIGLKE